MVVLDLRGVSGYTDFLVIGSGNSDRQLEAIADGVEKELTTHGHRVIGSEGQRGGRWVLLDFVDFVVHVFSEKARKYYDLERLWKAAKRLEPYLALVRQGGWRDGGALRVRHDHVHEAVFRHRTAA